MKGLVKIPQINDLMKAYSELQNTAAPLSAKRIMELCEWTRFDPRLLEQLVQHLATHWKKISPFSLKEAAIQSIWPGTLGVVLEQMKNLLKIKVEKKLFFHWEKIATMDLTKATGELFFIGLNAFAGKIAKQEAFYSSKIYSKWGFLGRDIIHDKGREFFSTRAFSEEVRKNIAYDLGKTRGQFSVNDYCFACQNIIGRRQAERDLNSFPFLHKRGNTRARVYFFIATKKKRVV